MDFQPLDTSLGQETVEVMKVPYPVDDIRTQTQENKTILFRDSSDYSCINNSETLKESNTLPKANSNLYGEILSFDSSRSSEITKEENKHPRTLTNDVSVNIHCGDSIQYLMTTERPKTCTKQSDNIVPEDNPSTDPIQRLITTNENPNTYHKQTNDSIPAGNPSTEPKTANDIIHECYPFTEPKTAKTSGDFSEENPSVVPKMLSKTSGNFSEENPSVVPKTSGESLRSERIQTNNIPTKDNSVFIWTPVCDIKQQFSRFRNNQSSDASHYTSDAFSQCKQRHNKQHTVYLNTALRKHTDLGLDRRGHTFSRPFTKKELELALPRKSFFSCHEKALKEAGYEVNTIAKGEHLTKPDNRRGTQATESPNSEFRTDINIVIMDLSDKDISKKEKIESETHELINKPNDMVTLKVPEVDKMAGKASGPTKLPPHSMKTKRPGTSKIEYLECKPLRKYLEYVKENEQEYLQFEQTSRIDTTEQQSGPSSLVKIGRAFQLRNHGGKMRPRDEPLVVATRALRPRTADFDKFSKYRDTDVWITEPSSNALKQQNKRNPDKNAQGMVAMPTINNDANPKSELEKLKLKAEEWCRSVPTNTVLKAKLWSLKELGICDVEVSDWSEAFKNCAYIRQLRP